MGRPSRRAERRAQILEAFALELGEHGFAGATIAAVAARAGVAPGLVHHHFDGKHDLLVSLLDDLLARFDRRLAALDDESDPVKAFLDAALALGTGSDTVAARCWVGLFAEGVRNPALFRRMRRVFDGQIETLEARGGGSLSKQDAGALLAFILGALVLGAFAPRKTAGFAAPSAHRFLDTLRRARARPSRGGHC
jgi:TetR/AcrR family transcriptional repressor of bet genes